MTKEELYEKWSKNINAEYIIPTLDAFFSKNTVLPNHFFESNICIPKGENRHKFADVLHEWIEGAEIQKTTGNDCWHTMLGIVEFMDVEARTVSQHYRSKPQEPVYEWLYYSRIGDTVWSTKEDAPMNMWCAEETKRIKQ